MGSILSIWTLWASRCVCVQIFMYFFEVYILLYSCIYNMSVFVDIHVMLDSSQKWSYDMAVVEPQYGFNYGL